MKNIFLDCGTHLCEGLIQFYNNGIIDDTFEIHTFEPNPACQVNKLIPQIPLNITSYNKAVWIEDGFISFNQENYYDEKGAINIDGTMSSIDGVGINPPNGKTKIKVPSIDFSRFVSELPEDSYIICKMDIEGAEFSVLRKMIKEKSILKIKKIFIEFHERFTDNESSLTVNELMKQINEMGVEANTWI
jgi:FkbM family methyltransferase